MGDVVLTREGSVGILTLDNPEVKNGLTAAMGRRIVELCDEVDGDDAIGAVVVQGASGTFCSGTDTRTWDPAVSPASDAAFDRQSAVYGAFVRIGRLRPATISAVRGAAVGAGMNLALATDLRIVSNSARLMAGFLRIGIHPGGGFFTLANRIAGRETAAALGIFSEEISGERAAALGIAWESVPDEQVEARALELARVAAKDPLLTRRAVASFRTELGPPSISWDAALEVERGVQMWSQNRRLERSRSQEGS